MAEEHGAAAKRSSRRNLAEELQEEILRHLPIKSLIRFESVCKSWRSKFYSHRFIALYGRHRPHPDVAVSNDNSNSPPLEFHTILRTKLLERLKLGKMINHKPSIYWKRTTCVFGPSSNGIYCLTSHPYDPSRDRYCVFAGQIALCNPATHDYKFANPFPLGIRSRLNSIASKPSRVHFGFGRIDSDYKVVVIVHYGNSSSSFLGFVYSLRSGQWKAIVDYKHGRRRRRRRNVGHKTEAFYRTRLALIEYAIEVCPQRFFQGCWHWTARGEDNSYYVLMSSSASGARFSSCMIILLSSTLMITL